MISGTIFSGPRGGGLTYLGTAHMCLPPDQGGKITVRTHKTREGFCLFFFFDLIETFVFFSPKGITQLDTAQSNNAKKTIPLI